MNWNYKGVEINESYPLPEGAIGFIYKIEQGSNKWHIEELNKLSKSNSDPGILGCLILENNPTKIYIGKKQLLNATKKRVGKREAAKQLLETGDKRKVKKIIRGTKVSNWLSYSGSCAELTADIKQSEELFRKEILEFAYSKKQLSYLETKYQFLYNVLEVDSYNNHIQNWYRKDLINDNK